MPVTFQVSADSSFRMEARPGEGRGQEARSRAGAQPGLARPAGACTASPRYQQGTCVVHRSETGPILVMQPEKEKQAAVRFWRYFL